LLAYSEPALLRGSANVKVESRKWKGEDLGVAVPQGRMSGTGLRRRKHIWLASEVELGQPGVSPEGQITAV